MPEHAQAVDESVADLDDDADYLSPDLTGYQTRLAHLRAEKGVVRLRFGTQSGLVLLRHADVMNAFREDGRYSKSLATRPTTFPFMGPNIMGYDGHEHTVQRSLVSPAFRRTAIPTARSSRPPSAAT